MGYDKPSPKFLNFLNKYYGLNDYIPQYNTFVVFKDYFIDVPLKKDKYDIYNNYSNNNYNNNRNILSQRKLGKYSKGNMNENNLNNNSKNNEISQKDKDLTFRIYNEYNNYKENQKNQNKEEDNNIYN